MRIDTFEVAKLISNNCHNAVFNIISNSHNKNNKNYWNVDLKKFKIYIKILLANKIQKTNTYTNSCKIYFVI